MMQLQSRFLGGDQQIGKHPGVLAEKLAGEHLLSLGGMCGGKATAEQGHQNHTCGPHVLPQQHPDLPRGAGDGGGCAGLHGGLDFYEIGIGIIIRYIVDGFQGCRTRIGKGDLFIGDVL